MATIWTPVSGSIPALVTPFLENDEIDWVAFGRTIDWHVEQGSAAIVVSGTTGESATISVDEQNLLLEFALAKVAGRLPVIAGTGANSTREAIELARAAERLGACAHLSVVPYYNKPNQEGIYRHFAAIADAVGLPMILYNVPGRTVADMSNETALRLSAHPSIVGIKDATGDIERGAELLARCGDGFAVYSGDDGTAMSLMLLGARGVISVTANAAPKQMGEMSRAAVAGDVETARAINRQLVKLHRSLFVEPNPIPLKWILNRMGWMENRLRLPLVPLSASSEPGLLDAMRSAQIESRST